MNEEWKEVTSNHGVHEYREYKDGCFEIRIKGKDQPYILITFEGLISETIDHQNIKEKCDCSGDIELTCRDCGETFEK